MEKVHVVFTDAGPGFRGRGDSEASWPPPERSPGSGQRGACLPVTCQQPSAGPRGSRPGQLVPETSASQNSWMDGYTSSWSRDSEALTNRDRSSASSSIWSASTASKTCPAVRHAERLFGEPDYLVRVATASLTAYQALRDEKLAVLPACSGSPPPS
jgi:hypothetical protein